MGDRDSQISKFRAVFNIHGCYLEVRANPRLEA